MTGRGGGADAEPHAVALPYRPRLADHVMVRRQQIAGNSRPCLVDSQRGAVYVLTEEELEHVLCMDGTRDFGGILLAAAQRGHYRRASDIERLLGEMQQAGVLVDGVAPAAPRAERCPDRPLAPLPGYRMRCDAVGACCTTFASVPFSQAEMLRAAAVAPERVDGPLERVFLPLWGSVDRTTVAVTMTDGQCPFLSEAARCLVHERAGAEAKPFSCSMFPRSFTDDGVEVRISVQPECPCVLASLESPPDEPDVREALVASAMRREGDLSHRVRITRLPPTIALTRTARAPREALGPWSAAIVDALEHGPCGPEGAERAALDAVASLWRLGAAVEATGLEPTAARAALGERGAPAVAAVRPHLEALAALAATRRDAARDRTARDRIRGLASWTEAAARALLDPATAAARLESAPFPAHERLYLAAVLWGHHLVASPRQLAAALRDRATRLLLARQMAFSLPGAAAHDPAAAFPIAGMEAMMRGQALERYADGLER